MSYCRIFKFPCHSHILSFHECSECVFSSDSSPSLCNHTKHKEIHIYTLQLHIQRGRNLLNLFGSWLSQNLFVDNKRNVVNNKNLLQKHSNCILFQSISIFNFIPLGLVIITLIFFVFDINIVEKLMFTYIY